MKSISILLLALCFTLPIFSQDLPKNDDGIISYTAVVNVSGKSADQLLDNAKRWFEETYKSARNRKVEGSKISDNHNLKMKKGSKDAGAVNYDISVMCKDGRYKYEITNLVHKDYEKTVGTGGKLEREEPKDGFSGKLWADFKMQSDAQVKELIASLTKAMEYTAEQKNDDW